LIVCGLLALATGCVQRRLIVRSDPPGALVYVDNYEVGRTPVGVNFLYYGVRQVRLVLDGHETMTEYVWFRPPWYEVFPIEFVAENFVPVDIQDRRELSYRLRPRVETATAPLVQRGEQLRSAATGLPPTSFGPRPPMASPAPGPGANRPAMNPPAVQPAPQPQPVAPPQPAPPADDGFRQAAVPRSQAYAPPAGNFSGVGGPPTSSVGEPFDPFGASR
jgi:hypothetical protein